MESLAVVVVTAILQACRLHKIKVFSLLELRQPLARRAGLARPDLAHTAPRRPPPSPPSQVPGSPQLPRTWFPRLLEEKGNISKEKFDNLGCTDRLD